MADDSGVTHELETFMAQVSVELAAEYSRIRARAVSDPGTAGDEGEENWRRLLAEWLPPTLNIQTKGRVLGINGSLSRQVDLVILTPSYPEKLSEKKVYLAGGVMAAFECKLTLKGEHIEKAAENARLISRMARATYTAPVSNLRRDLRSPVSYGILAHSHVWKTEPADRVERLLNEELVRDSHPSEMLDSVCVADLGFWYGARFTLPPPHFINPEVRLLVPQAGTVQGQYHRAVSPTDDAAPNPLHALIGHIINNLAWDVTDLRPLATYWQLAKVAGAGMGMGSGSRLWSYDVFTEYVRQRLNSEGIAQGDPWNPWGGMA
ncbi:hypothetical protein KBX08_25215 [Micromonospora sp. H61]|uniref:DUF6602 domain-containing protein n=1 Tax=Micromonospora sp. H61 TaxID=2824888 RepID=UPI001B3803AD|nr:DUF6602 domain-containing protein [Micromonospora sp. H61]MBQ0993376.1 hypothetical protein [Micromonospora sp. H61]